MNGPYYFLDAQEDSVLYAVCEEDRSLIAFRSVPEGLKRLDPRIQFEAGARLCQMTKLSGNQNGKGVSPAEMLVNCYGGRSIARIALDENGAPSKMVQRFFFEKKSVNPSRQTHSFPHSVNLGPNGWVYVCDLGADKIWILKWIDADGERKLVPNDPFFVTARPGCGPRHMVFHPTLPAAFVDNELTNDVTVYRIQPDGSLKDVQTVASVPENERNGKIFIAVSEMRLRPDGKFLYVANRGHNSVTAFRVEEDGTLTFLETEPSGGNCPRGLVLDASGRFLVVPNRVSAILLMKIEPDGTLSPTEYRFQLPGEVPGAAILKTPDVP